MRGDWKAWARASNWRVDGDSFWVPVGNRQQRITMAIETNATLLRSRVARKAVLNSVSEPERRAWERNRVSELVGFRVDRQGVMLAETPVPADAGRDEWQYIAFNLARAADRFESHLSGQDEE